MVKMAKKAKRGRPRGSKNAKPTGIDVDKYLSPVGLAATATELKASIRALNYKLKAINSLLRALKKEGK